VQPPKYLLVDTAAGLSDSVAMFAAAADDVVLVVCDEPASITDAYALIKVLSRDFAVRRFRMVANMVRNEGEARQLHHKLSRVSDRFLDVVIEFSGWVPHDERLRQAIKQQSAVVDRWPSSRSALAFKQLAGAVDRWEEPERASLDRIAFLVAGRPPRQGIEMSVASEYLQHSRESADELVRRHAPLVRRIAYHLMGRLPASVDVGDLIQAGMIGLLEAARHFALDRGASFETYAGIRIRGAMLDELRRTDWTPRSVHRKTREVAEVIRQIETETGAEANDAEVMKRLGIGADEYHQVLADAACVRLLSLTAPDDGEESSALDVADEAGLNPAEHIERDGMREALVEAIGGLPEREQLVMSLYYEQELNLKEIGAVLGVSESRVCQIHGQAVIRLRARMSGWRDG